jgi:hypothetical protein
MRRPHMSTRRWMTMIAVVAVVLATVVWQERLKVWRQYCKEKVEYHARLARSWRTVSEGHAKEAAGAMALANDPGVSDKKRRWLRSVARSNGRGAKYLGSVAEYHRQMRDKWLSASHSVFLGVDPDPPEP